MAIKTTFDKTENGFSGIDMIVTFDGLWIGELQGISYSVTREKAPTFTMGSPNPRAFSRGKRGISGALVFAVFDRSAILQEMNKETRHHYHEKNGGGANVLDFTKGDAPKAPLNMYPDQILPFNIVINGANEYGESTNMEIVGVELMQTGSGMSIDDVQTNEQYSFVAREIKFFGGKEIEKSMKSKTT